MEYYFHTTGNNERWDLIAYKYYGNCYEMQKIIDANPHVPITPYIKEGTEIKIPFEEKQRENNLNLLPIWKRSVILYE